MCWIRLIGGSEELEMNLVHPADEIHRQARTEDLLGQAITEPRRQAHLKKSAIVPARPVIQPVFSQPEIPRHLHGCFQKECWQWCRSDKLARRIHKRHDIRVMGCTLAKTSGDQGRTSTDDQPYGFGLRQIEPARKELQKLVLTHLLSVLFSFRYLLCVISAQ